MKEILSFNSGFQHCSLQLQTQTRKATPKTGIFPDNCIGEVEDLELGREPCLHTNAPKVTVVCMVGAQDPQ